ncbi:putative MFS family arabinose efflux permease [Isoptericola jiangsuensis]|uniref:Putative MFS family arabinose efflux permease n=1 Tax=Isoptericola jiangsuensis TaxID=548579 RepID=A0A2A9EYZ0_9MICO|nr:MFS transporter [Isoptericola jiangsuensis]PFG44274.1 putative MFS family arabinose efflux permease [Isoptericola jiangsuensis]
MRNLLELIAPARLGSGFRWLLASSWTSNVGDGIALAAGPLLVASLTDSAALVALAALLPRLPWLVFGLWAGAMADRWDRRRLVIVSNALRAVVIAVLVAAVLTGRVDITFVLVALLLMGVAEVFADSAAQTLLPMLVDSKDLGLGNARLQAGFLTANQLAGPPLGAALFAVGSAWPFAVQLVCGVLAIVQIGRLRVPPVERDVLPTHVRRDIADGLRWLWANPPVRTLALVIFTFNLTWAAPWAVLVLYSTEHLGMGPVGFGLLTTASGIGGLVATVLYGRLERRFSLATLMKVCLTLEVVFHLALALTTTGWVALVILFVFGLYAFVWGTVSNTVRQRAVPTALQGRVGSVYMVGVFGGIVVGNALGGLLAEAFGITAPFWFAFVGAGLTLALVWRQLDHIAHAEAD